MSYKVKGVSETLKNKGRYVLKENVRVIAQKTNFLGMHKSKKFRIDDSEGIDKFLEKNGGLAGMAFFSDKGRLTYWKSDFDDNEFYISDMYSGARYHPDETNVRGVMTIDV